MKTPVRWTIPGKGPLVALSSPRLELFHRWDYKLGAFLCAGRPARGYGFRLCIKTDRIRSMLVEIAEARPLPATKRVVGERDRNSEVYAYHPYLHAVDEIAGGVAVAREDRNSVSVFMFRRQTHGFFVVLRPYHRKNRPEDFLFVDPHVRLDLVEQAATHEVSVFVPLQFEAAAIDDKFGTFLHAQVDIVLHLIQIL